MFLPIHFIPPSLYIFICLHLQPILLFLIYFLAPSPFLVTLPILAPPPCSPSHSSICSSISPDRLWAPQRDRVTIRRICLPYPPAISPSASLPLLYHPSFFNLAAPSLQPTIHHFPPDGVQGLDGNVHLLVFFRLTQQTPFKTLLETLFEFKLSFFNYALSQSLF